MRKTFIIPAALVITATVAAGCGNTQSAVRATTTPTPARTSSAAAPATSAAPITSAPATSAPALDVSSCPSQRTVERALGTTLSAPSISVETRQNPAFPPVASAFTCYYSHQSGSGKKTWINMVWITIGANVPASYFDAYKQAMAGTPFQLQTNPPLRGMDRSGTYLLNHTEDNGQVEPVFGVVGMKGTHYVEISTEGVASSESSITGELQLELSLLQGLASGLK